MARIKTINFQRVTLSFPKKVLDELRTSVGKNNMSSYVAGLVEKDLKEREQESIDEFMLKIRAIGEDNKKHSVDPRSSLEILREMRYEGKY